MSQIVYNLRKGITCKNIYNESKQSNPTEHSGIYIKLKTNELKFGDNNYLPNHRLEYFTFYFFFQ